MSEVKIIERIIVDEPQNVEKVVFNITGQRVEFELIRKFILNEKNTMFYLDRKMNSSTEPGNYSDYLWLDTGYRDSYGNPIMICLHNGYDGYVGHHTGTIKELSSRVKSFNRKNAKDIERNYSRFVSKYKMKSEEREISYIDNADKYALSLANRNCDFAEENVFSRALREAGIEFEEEIQETVSDEIDVVEEEFSEAENEITIGILIDQMESMQNYIDELLNRIESHEKASAEEIMTLKAQNQEYKKALVNIRLFNAENETTQELSEEEKVLGHNLLGKNERILVFGNADIRVAEMRAIARDFYGFEKGDFEFVTDYEKIKTAGSRIHGSERFAAVIFGNCPHKVMGIGNYNNIIDEFKQREDCPISVDARTEAGELKITKQSFRNALTKIYVELKKLQAA